ncbi:PorP/SprF family type IX secretion system membrane protein [Crocinitomix algicola]|uniref:PorP/SprF family type IX secretion system membrane protein n=1 Tax=Crocinitomix algicola TaxID=1740263 RepID=UPI000830F2AF|nr:type IX secretion system membrane protein PorP/SprF [Crocinitomix algicola]
MKYIIYISFLLSSNLYGQLDALYSQYTFNQFNINPAYAGSRDAMNVNLTGRSQWLGLSGAPNTQNVAINSPASNYNLAWGFDATHDQYGPYNHFSAQGALAYRLRLERGNLHLGLRGGAYNLVLDHAQLKFREDNDQLDNQTKYSSVVPNFDFGLYYYSQKFYAGLSINHLTASKFHFQGLNNELYHLNQQVHLMAGYVFNLNPQILLKPTVLIRYAQPQTISTDLNANFMFYQRFWLGIGTRNLNSLNFLGDLYVTDYLRIGYSYDMTLTELQKFANGSHEILIGFDFNVKKPIVTSPRYL